MSEQGSELASPSIAKGSNENGLTVIEGCRACGKDDDHAHLLLCEACNDEYHTYCLSPPLDAVPRGDFFCTNCKFLKSFIANDELDLQVSALPPLYTSRYMEIIWAAGGQSFGWWPACIYDPRLVIGNARKLALKNLGKKHLVYFFGCPKSPFTVLIDQKCMEWQHGLIQDFDLGKAARSMGKKKFQMFEWALQAAKAENEKSIESRLDWNHQNDPYVDANVTTSSRGSFQSTSNSNSGNSYRVLNQNGNDDISNPKKKAKKSQDTTIKDLQATRRSNRPVKPTTILENSIQEQNTKTTKTNKIFKTNRQSIIDVINAMDGNETNDSNHIEGFDDSEHFFCKILKKIDEPLDAPILYDVNIGFITLPCKKSSTFLDARKSIETEFDTNSLSNNRSWKFYIPHLGPLSTKQEEKFALFDLLIANGDGMIGDGTSRYPLKIIILE
mmetsp:Transcript_15853/g.18068  ORF Transcript_15853/g.18068 Transcript_15853/m.18068 type:complete len:443 (-) Transcript_15853:275-1603(-)